MFGRNKKAKDQEELEQEEEPEVEQPIGAYYVRYMGGHPQYPKARDVLIALWSESLGIYFDRDKPADIVIPYKWVTNIESMTEEQMKLGRVLVFGIIGALWKKKHHYTIIEYQNEHNIKCPVVLDLEGKIEDVQSVVYQKMVEQE